MKKVTSIIDYLQILNELKEEKIELKSLENVLLSLYAKDLNSVGIKIFAVPVCLGEHVAVLIPTIIPGPLKGIADFEYTVSIMTISHLNFAFMIYGEMYVVTD